MSDSSAPTLNDAVREYWEAEPCGTQEEVTTDAAKLSKDWFERVEEHRYQIEPVIHAVAQFTRHRGKRVLEVGVGAGTDHLQWARAGVDLYGVDLTDAAIETTRARLSLYGLSSNLRRLDAESLPFEDDTFDIVYSWGVIHHAEHPGAILAEIHRVLRRGGRFIGMFYGRRSPVVFRMWVRHALLAGRPWRSPKDVVWHHMESVGTKAYTQVELRRLFADFGAVELKPVITAYDERRFPRWLSRFFPDDWGWFIAVNAAK